MKILLQTVGKEYSATAPSVEEGLIKLGLSWDQIKGKGTILITKRKLSHEHLFNTLQLKRLFGNKLTMRLWAGRLESLLK